MKNAHYCMDNPQHIFTGNYLDGIRCPYCDGLVNMMAVTSEVYQKLPKYRDLKKRFSKRSNEIEIMMSDVNEPPKIKLNGEEIKGIMELDYKYVTKSSKPGFHNFTVKYCDKGTNTIRTVSANKIWEE